MYIDTFYSGYFFPFLNKPFDVAMKKRIQGEPLPEKPLSVDELAAARAKLRALWAGLPKTQEKPKTKPAGKQTCTPMNIEALARSLENRTAQGASH